MSRVYRPRSFRALRQWRHFLRGNNAVGVGELVACWRNGFYPDRAVVYDFRTWGHDQFLPDGVHRKPDVADADYAARSGDKVIFFLFMRAIGGPTPTVFAENVGGRVIHYAGHEEYEALLAERGELVIKPRDGVKGGGVRIVRPGDPDRLLQPNEFASEKAVQHPYAAAIYPHSINTVRILTALDEPSGEFFVMAAAHRFGTATSGRVDNWSAGGVAAGIDLETGRLARATRQPDFDPARTWWTNHPDTGAPIEGVEIPRFAETCRSLLEVCRRFALTLAGWDVVITPDGWTLLEVNTKPALNLFQLHRPLLADARAKAFFRRERMV